MFDFFSGQQATQQREFLVGDATAIAKRQPEMLEFLHSVADPEDIAGPARADVVEHADVLGQSSYIVEGQQNGQIQHQLLCAGSDRRPQQQRRWQIAVVCAMVFTQDHGEASTGFSPGGHLSRR